MKNTPLMNWIKGSLKFLPFRTLMYVESNPKESLPPIIHSSTRNLNHYVEHWQQQKIESSMWAISYKYGVCSITKPADRTKEFYLAVSKI